MSIQDIASKFKVVLHEDATFYSALIIVVAVASFGLGKLSVLEQRSSGGYVSTPIQSIEPIPQDQISNNVTRTEVLYVGSKNGSKYHLLWCPGAQQIREENKVWFNSEDEARAAGYTPASNCKGLTP